MELHQLRYFVAAAEAGSITRAADRCRVSQPTLSQQLQRLEASLGHSLFDRLGRGVALTPAGAALLPRARRILAEADDAREHLAGEVERGVGTLRLGAIPTIAPYVLPSVIARLRRRFPSAGVEVREDLTEALVERLASGELDAAIVSTPIDHHGVRLRVLGSEPMLVVAPAASDVGEEGGLTLADLRERPRVALHEMHCLGQQISGFCSAKNLGASVACSTAQLATLLEFVRLGLGVSIVPEMAAVADRSRERRYTRFKRGGPRREIALATPAGRTPPATLEAVALFASDRLREMQAAASARFGG
ncbi:MAG: LysR family transcriptional regulator [Phycisphaerales bacterium]|nr:MAG: LysR family transcriptional regulator [Phycisphaerales bacterium]